MSSSPTIVKAFHRLEGEELEVLCAFTEQESLLVKGIDRSDNRPYRAGCLPYIGLVAAGLFGFVGSSLGMKNQVATGLSLTCAILATLALIRAFRAMRRSRQLLAREEGWHVLAWTAEAFCFRSLESCLLAPWDHVEDIRVFGGDDGRFLGDTLWLHLADKERILVAPRTEDGRFAGRGMREWYEDLRSAWTKSTGLRPSAGESE